MARNAVFSGSQHLIPEAQSGERRGVLQISPIEASVCPSASHPIASEVGRLVNLRIVCAWCGDEISAGRPGGPVARGLMCRECAKGHSTENCGLVSSEVSR